ncbi:hypothetical protein KNP414_02145 [Paenibacillus mucilaginosus KNP414]|uniref:Uncharacterized protein n=1 Tax=Paenibacillus mucilaginosus (strain KNP414) TaxID=1036673 RepID=F8F4X6_PAEMK|nr:hypothetical protein KNP414_02145 [Paenibacillus mucilaginosus KNP414]
MHLPGRMDSVPAEHSLDAAQQKALTGGHSPFRCPAIMERR